MDTSNRILYVVNAAEYFVSHRLPIAQRAQQAGYSVHVAATGLSGDASDAVDTIKHCGFTYHDVPINRGGQNPLTELGALINIYFLIRKLSPKLVHLVTIKPVLYGGIAARLNGVPAVVVAVAGLGTVFLASSIMARLRRWFVTRLMSSAFKVPGLAAIFQNSDDCDALVRMGVLQRSQARIIRGSGVSLEKCAYIPEPAGKPVVVMASRLLKDKGVQEFVEAARILRARCVDIEMRLIGYRDPGNPTSLSQQDIENWRNEGVIEYLGFQENIASQYSAAHIVCLPSYREGLPKSLVEAAACGRAVVTTDVPGCRDAITPNETGLLVPVKDAVALANAIQQLAEDRELREKMGKAGRKLAESEFAIEKIVDQHIKIYEELGIDA
jgi:glycosyltransferase involved in cell wall biosynthesis